MKLYYYSDLSGCQGWFPAPDAFRPAIRNMHGLSPEEWDQLEIWSNKIQVRVDSARYAANEARRAGAQEERK